MAARNMANGIDHNANCQAKCERHPQKIGSPERRSASREIARAGESSASSVDQEGRAKKFRHTFLRQGGRLIFFHRSLVCSRFLKHFYRYRWLKAANNLLSHNFSLHLKPLAKRRPDYSKPSIKIHIKKP